MILAILSTILAGLLMVWAFLVLARSHEQPQPPQVPQEMPTALTRYEPPPEPHQSPDVPPGQVDPLVVRRLFEILRERGLL